MGQRRRSFAIRRLGVAATALLLCACVSRVRLAPDAPAWQTAGSDASWRADPVVVVARLDTDAGALPARGVVVNTGTATVRVTFVPEAGPAGGVQAPLDMLVAGVPYEVPAAFDLAPGVLEFALPADELWAGLPPEGAPITWTIVVTTASGEAQCPFRFRVASASKALDPDVEAGVATVLLTAAFLALGYYVYY
jgi:hypothetical protein